jgi:hypothetical protein
MPTPVERKAMNEGRFRDANEQLERGARQILESGDSASLVPFLCECPRLDCSAVVLLTLEEYEDVRAAGERGLAMIGHEDGSIEHVVARNDRFLTTEKFGPAGDIHADRNPRT